jgi:adenylate cyclase class IV
MFNRRLTYLGSIITNDLKDSTEFHATIGKANRILHGLNNLWRSKGLSVKMEKQYYITTVVNIVLWGCELLTL